MFENLEFKELPLHAVNNLKSTDLKLNADPIYDFEDETEDNKYVCTCTFIQLLMRTCLPFVISSRSGKLFDVDGGRCGYFNFDDAKFWRKLDELIKTVTALHSD